MSKGLQREIWTCGCATTREVETPGPVGLVVVRHAEACGHCTVQTVKGGGTPFSARAFARPFTEPLHGRRHYPIRLRD